MKIAIRFPNWIGDVVMSLPAAAAIRSAFPDAELIAICRPWARDLLNCAPHLIDRTLVFDDRGADAGPLGLVRFALKLRRLRPDRAFVFTRHAKGKLMMVLAGVRHRVGFSVTGRLLLRVLSKPPAIAARHESLRYLDLIEESGITERSRFAHMLRVRPEDAAPVLADFVPQMRGRWIAVHAGAAYGTAKRWPYDRYAAVIKQLLQTLDVSIGLLGVAAEADVNAAIVELVDDDRVHDLSGKTTLSQAIALISAADLMISNDSGLMHVASALGVPQVAIFGPTDESATFPDQPDAVVLARGEVACRPCFKRHCPIDHRCMTGIETDRVVRIAKDLLRRKRTNCVET